MADNIGTMALKITADGQDLVQGITAAQSQINKFAQATKDNSAEVQNAFKTTSDKTASFFDAIRSPGGKGIFEEAKSGLSGLLGNLAGGAGAAGIFGAAIGGALGTIAEKARETSKELFALGNFAQRIGASVHDAQVLTQALRIGGVQDAESTLNRLFRRLGELRQDPTGGTAQTLERIGLDPQHIQRIGSREAIEEIVVALGRVPNVFDRAAASQEIFGKGFQEVQELVRQGRRAFELGEIAVSAFGADAETVKVAREAELAWFKFGRTVEGITGPIKKAFDSAFASISLGIASSLNSIIDFIKDTNKQWAELFSGPRRPTTDRVATGGGTDWGEAVRQARTAQEEINAIVSRGPRIRPVTGVDVQVRRETEAVEDRVRLNATLVEQAQRLGLVGANATRQEADAVRDLLTQRDALIKKGAAGAELARFDAAIRAEAESRRAAIGDTQVRQIQREIGTIGLTTSQVAERQLREQGVNAAVAERAGLLAHERDTIQAIAASTAGLVSSTFSGLDRLGVALGQIDQARNRLRGGNGLPFLNEVQALRAFGASIREAGNQLGGPSSFVVQQPTLGSVEDARQLAEIEIRQRNLGNDPQSRAVTILETLRELQTENNRLNEEFGRAVVNMLNQLPQNPAPI